MQLPSRQQEPPESTGESPHPGSFVARIPWPLRAVYCGVGLGLIALLILARTLSPDPSGIGTHEQLGLPPCGVKFAFGIPCPSCGMTTSWALATRGQILQSARCNVGGLLMAALALPAAVGLILGGLRGRWVVWDPDPLVVSGMLALIMLAAIVQWVIRVPFV